MSLQAVLAGNPDVPKTLYSLQNVVNLNPATTPVFLTNQLSGSLLQVPAMGQSSLLVLPPQPMAGWNVSGVLSANATNSLTVGMTGATGAVNAQAIFVGATGAMYGIGATGATNVVLSSAAKASDRFDIKCDGQKFYVYAQSLAPGSVSFS